MTHPNFRSIVDCVYNADDIEDMVGSALLHQNMLDKRTSPWEISEWGEDELQNFAIELENIDRLYHIHHFDDGVSGRDFELLARLDHNGRSVYVKMTAGCNFTGFESDGGGDIYVSLDAQIFLKSVVGCQYDPHAIWESMVQDGLIVEEPTEFDLLQAKSWHSVPKLDFLCHMSVYNEQDKLQHYEDDLPLQLAASVQDFRRVRQTRDHHDFEN